MRSCPFRTFTTKQGRCLLEVTRRIAPVADLTDIRHNILLHKLRIYHSAMADHVPEQHPPEIQRMIRVREMRADRQRLQEKIAAKRAALDTMRAKVAENGRNSSSTNVEVRIARANIGMLAAKLHALDSDLCRERTVAETIIKLMPVRFNAAIHSAEQAAVAIDNTMATLQEHYADMASNAEATPLNTSSDIWSRLTRHVANVSNSTLWSQIGAAQTRNVDAIKQLCAEATRLKQQLSANNTTDYQTARCQFKVFLTRARTKHIGIELRMAALETDYDSDASELYDLFSTRVHSQCQKTASSVDQYDEMAVEQYILELMASLMLKGQMDFLNTELAITQREYDSKSKSLTDHTVLLAKLQSVYAESELTINETRDASAALSVIKAKLQDLEQTSRKLVQDRRTGSQQTASLAQRRLHNATINSTMAGNTMDVSQSSFNFSRSDLCSTRLEDMTESPANAMGSPMKPKQTSAPHVAELNAYLDVQLGNLMQSTACG